MKKLNALVSLFKEKGIELKEPVSISKKQFKKLKKQHQLRSISGLLIFKKNEKLLVFCCF